MTSKKAEMLQRVSAHAAAEPVKLWKPKSDVPAPVQADFGPDWTPITFESGVPIPVPFHEALARRMAVLERMEVGQSFPLPGHLVKLWAETATKLRARVLACVNRKFAFRKVDELNSRMWRVK